MQVNQPLLTGFPENTTLSLLTGTLCWVGTVAREGEESRAARSVLMGEQRAREDVKWSRAASISRGKAIIIDRGKPWCHRRGSSQRLGEKKKERLHFVFVQVERRRLTMACGMMSERKPKKTKEKKKS